MPVIKAHSAPTSIAAFSMRDIEGHARGLIQKARAQAEAMIAAATEEAEALRQEAHALGRAEGQRQGLDQGREQGTQLGKQAAFDAEQPELAAAAALLHQVAAEVEARMADFEEHAKADVLELALAIARRVTRQLGAVNPGVVTANVESAVRLIVSKSDLRIAINPQQRAIVDELLPRLRTTWPQMKHVELVDDPAITCGGCRVSSHAGEIDADLERQLQRVVAELVGES